MTAHPPGGRTDFTVPWIDFGTRYEGALVFSLPPADEEDVRAFRRSRPVPGAVESRPHLTLLFLGHPTGRQLMELVDRLHPLRHETIETRTRGLDTFRHQGRVINLHLRVEPVAGLLALHRRALALGRGFEWFDPGIYCGDHYRPHVSLFDRIAIPPEEMEGAGVARGWSDRPLRLGDLHVMADPLGRV